MKSGSRTSLTLPLILKIMEKQKFITETPQTTISKSHHGWVGETYVKIKGYCYMITTMKSHSGVIVSTARKVNDEGSSNGFRSVSYTVFSGESWTLMKEKANATESKIREIHTAALNKFLAMDDQLPSKKEAYVVKPGQVITCIGPGLSENRDNVIYMVEGNRYYYVNTKTLELCHDNMNLLRNISKKFGIGKYYKEGDMMNIDEVNDIVLDAIEKQKRDEEERPAREAKAKAERAAKIAALKAEYPYLIEKKDRSGGVFAARNIRIELSRHFPEVKFSVNSTYSTVRIVWTDGPTAKEVMKIVSKYKDHIYDYSSDYLDYSPSLFNEVFGGCNYIFTTRKISEATMETIKAWANEVYPDMADRKIYDLFENNAIPSGAWRISLNEKQMYHIEAVKEDQSDSETMPETEAKAESTELTFNIRNNTEKGGIEISFEQKPDDKVLQMLKDIGFRWSRFNRVWWIKNTPEAQRKINALLKA